ncbi:MAG TPA: response regulator transcription factor [Anaerolineales bacterium]
MDKFRILLIDDDEILLELLADHIHAAGYEPLVANSGSEGLHLATVHRIDLVVLDIMMPILDGWEVCRRLRENSNVPIIMLTAKGEEIDKLRGFRLGVDDYVTKPFSFAELVARVGAILTRLQRSNQASNQIVSHDLVIDLNQHQVTVSGQVVDLTPTEYRLLEILARYANRTVPTEKLLHEIWGREYGRESDHVKHYIWALRNKIEVDPGDPKHILTDRGFGYRFE